MSSLEDKILGEKKQYYCDSSSDDCEEDDDNGSCRSTSNSTNASSTINNTNTAPIRERDGSSVNTGPKGVLNDWQRYKQLQAVKREQDDAERRALVNKLSLTCRSNLDDERDKKRQEDAKLDKELEETLDDDFLKEYVQKRMEEMVISSQKLPKFGRVISLETGDAFLQAVDKEKKEITIIVHLYEDGASGCKAMNGCLQCLAQEYPQVKFCKLSASVAGLTKHFKISGVPALLAYKGGVLVGNFVQLVNEFGDDFFADNVESFLIENGILPDKTLVPELIRQSHSMDDDAGSDFDVD